MSASSELHKDPGIPSDRGAQRSILIATLDDLSIPHHLAGVIGSATQWTHKHLTIIFLSKLFDRPSSTSESQESSISHTQRWNEVQSLLTFVYVQATRVAQQLDRVLMEVDVLLKGTDETLPDDLADGADILYRVHDDISPPPHPLSSIRRVTSLFGDKKIPSNHPISSSPHPDAPPLYPVVVLGGTFDHLHAGHKILLSMAAWIASEKIIVGVTDDVLLTKKSNKEVLEDLQIRISKVTSFLSLFRPGLIYDVVPIDDVYGPTGWDPNIQALVVSKETLSGAASIASLRIEKGLPALQTFTIDVISPTESNLGHDDVEMLKQTKMSSTFIREWIVKNRNK